MSLELIMKLRKGKSKKTITVAFKVFPLKWFRIIELRRASDS